MRCTSLQGVGDRAGPGRLKQQPGHTGARTSVPSPQRCRLPDGLTHPGAPAAAGTRRPAQRRAGLACCAWMGGRGGSLRLLSAGWGSRRGRALQSLLPACTPASVPSSCILPRQAAAPHQGTHRYSWSLSALNWQAPSPATRRSMRQKSCRRSCATARGAAGEGDDGACTAAQRPGVASARSSAAAAAAAADSHLQPRPPLIRRLARHALDGRRQQLHEAYGAGRRAVGIAHTHGSMDVPQ